MTIRKGEDWGRPGTLPDDGVRVRSDAHARSVVSGARLLGEPIPVFGLLGGDLARAMGATGDEARLRSPQARTFAVDLGSVELDGEPDVFVAHLAVHRRWWSGPFAVVMNAEYLGAWKVAPRAHPGDGKLDVLEGRLSFDDRLKARKRLPHGDHVPHPDISVRQVAEAEFHFDRPNPVFLDGERWGNARHIVVRVEPDALRCVV